MTTTQTKYYTEEEYLKLEETAEYKNEYLDGEILPMVGATTNHNKILGNFYKKFPLTISGQEYDIYIETVKLWMAEYRFYTYPDIMIIKGQPVYHGEGKITVVNPLIIVEVLSPSTQGYERGDKFKYYRSLPTFQEYILVEQDSYAVEQYSKQAEDKWSVNFYSEKQATLQLTSLDWQISLEDLYARVEFNTKDEQQ